MRSTSRFLLTVFVATASSLTLPAGSAKLVHAQSINASEVPVGSLIDFKTAEGGVEGIVLDVQLDSVWVRKGSDSESTEFVVLPVPSIRSMRIKQTSAIWTLQTETPTKWELLDESGGTDSGGATIYSVTKQEIASLDAYTGLTRWRLPSAPYVGSELDRLKGIEGLSRESLVLLLLESDDEHARVVALNSATGELEWELRDAFTYPPSDLESFPILSLRELDRLFLYFNRDGPLLVESISGNVVWHSKSLFGRPVPDPGRGAAYPVVDDSVVYVPTQRGVAALSLDDGVRRWEMWDDDRFMPSLMRLTPWGLLVVGWDIDHAGASGRLQLSLLDTTDGKVLWDLRPEEGSRAVIRADSVFLAGISMIEAIDIASGGSRTLAKWKPPSKVGKFIMALQDFSMDEQGYYLGWSFGSMTLSSQGREKSRIKLEPPGATIGEAFAAGIVGLPWTRRSGAGNPGSWYVYTGEPINPSITGFNLARIDQRKGAISGRVWIDERKPDYWITPGLALVLRKGEKMEQISAYPFTGCETLENAIAVGSESFVDTLMARGMRPGFHSENECQPVLAAASAERPLMVAKLLADGWSSDESSPEGWTPLHFASRDGDSEVVRLLLESGAPVAGATRGRYPWTPLLLAVKEGHDSVAALLDRHGAVEESSRLSLMRSWSYLEEVDVQAAGSEREAALAASSVLRYPPRYRSLFCYQSLAVGLESQWPDDCDREVEENRLDPFAYLIRGHSRGLAGDLAGAEADFRECARLDPFDALADHCLFAAEGVARGSAPEPLPEKVLDLSGPIPE
jgi:outer membrane protein assembly factor BamB